MRDKHFRPPTVSPGMTEADLDQFCRGYLQGLVANNLVVSYFTHRQYFIPDNNKKKQVTNLTIIIIEIYSLYSNLLSPMMW